MTTDEYLEEYDRLYWIDRADEAEEEAANQRPSGQNWFLALILIPMFVWAMNHKRFTIRLVSVVTVVCVGEHFLAQVMSRSNFLWLDKFFWIPTFYLISVGFKNPFKLLSKAK